MNLHAQVSQCDLSVLSYSECKIAIFFLATLVEKPASQKIARDGTSA